MPGINRIRIINFSYNNDAREIVDETFDFYGGENALLNLANGGGKSVLIQLMMQPILPDLKIQKRRMADYIRQSTGPIFVILEWMLDNPSRKDYLMTGIVVAPRSSMQNEDSNKINYFTFASHYDQASEFDLFSVPFVGKENGQMRIMSFERSREAVKKLAASHREIFYFSREDEGEYRKLLLNFGISQEEWKNIIARMNNDEGGIDELFERCGTSDAVFNEWIIKNIEKAQLAGEREGTAIEELLAGLVSDTIKNEEYLKSQKMIEHYLGRHKELEEHLERVCKSLEGLSQAEKDLSAMYQALNKQMKEAEASLLELEARQGELEEELLGIRKEKGSQQFYEAEERLLQVRRLAEEKRAEQEAISRQVKENRYLLECFVAARILEDCRRMQGKINGIRGRIEALQGDLEGTERIDALAYSLRMWCEGQCEELKAHITALEADLDGQQTLLKDFRVREAEIDQELTRLSGQEGILKSETGRFERYEAQRFKELGTSFLRNVLKVLDRADVKKFERGLMGQEVRENGRLTLLEDRKEDISLRLTQLSGLLLEQAQRIFEAKHGCSQLADEWDQMEAWKNGAGDWLIKYELPKTFIYEAAKAVEVLEENIRRQEDQKNQLLTDKKQIADMIYGIENHCVYLPEILLKAVEKRDIACQTGETYLGNLNEERRSQQLLKNPLLPFGLIVSSRDRKRLEEVPFGDCFLRQVIPVFTYEQLDQTYPVASRIVEVGAEIGLICAYEERIITDQQDIRYVEQLREEENRLVDFIRHREEELKQLREAAAFFQGTEFNKDKEEDLELRLEEAEKTLERLEKEKQNWDWEQESLMQEQRQNEAMRSNACETLEKIGRKKDHLKEYLEQNEEYEEQYERLCEVKEAYGKAAKEKAATQKRLDEGRKNETRIREDLIHTGHQRDQEIQRLLRYQEAKPAVLLTEPFAAMEQEYELLSASFNDSLNALRMELEEQGKEYQKQMKDLSALTVCREDYENLIFDREEEFRKKGETKYLEEEQTRCYQEISALDTQMGDAKAGYRQAELGLKDLGLAMPLPKDEIRQEYERRRQDTNRCLSEVAKEKKEAARQKDECKEIAGRIEDLDIPLVLCPGMVLMDDRRKQFKILREAWKEASRYAVQVRKDYGILYHSVCQEYKGRNQCVTDILDSLANLRTQEGMDTYETVYFSMEEFIRKRESLVKLLDFYEGQLANIVRTKSQIVDQCVSYARIIYEDVKFIARKSRVQLSGKSRPVQMLKIGVPEELDSEVKQRMTKHIDDSLQILAELGKAEDIPEKKWKEKLSLFMSPRELFNQLIGTNKVPVYVYKIDLNEKGSGLKRWEDAMIQNSGGEKVVAFFTMISTLISYVRDVTSQRAGGDFRQESKVLIMDNPFGRTSSEHLLKAIMDIARTFHIQLICLSDLSQSSITNRFSLIYQLSVRKRMYSDKEVLKSEPVRINKPGIEKNERLEHAGVYEREGQKTLWEFMKDI